MSPEQFWRLHPAEFWWLVEARAPRKVYAGGLSEDEVSEMYDDLMEARRRAGYV